MSFHRNHWLLLGVILFGFIGLAIIIAISPAIWVQNHSAPLAGSKPLSALEHQGFEVYIAEGCIGCHTQQVRPLQMDQPWGRPSAPGDYAHIQPMDLWRPYAPAVLGSARTGPDLSNIGNRQSSATWHYIHLYNPRAVVGASVMPAYPWLFQSLDNPPADATVVPVPAPYAPDTGKLIPTEKGRALVAYLLALRQTPIASATKQVTADAKAAPAGEKRARQQPVDATAANGAALYSSHCASCHQASGQGLPGVFPPLAGDPVVNAENPADHINTVLHGLQGKTIGGTAYGSPMPPFGDQLSDAEIAAIINHERTSWGNAAPTVTPEAVARLRSAGGSQ